MLTLLRVHRRPCIQATNSQATCQDAFEHELLLALRASLSLCGSAPIADSTGLSI